MSTKAAEDDPDLIGAMWVAVETRRDGDAYDELNRSPDTELLVIAAVGERLAEMAREVWRDRMRY